MLRIRNSDVLLRSPPKPSPCSSICTTHSIKSVPLQYQHVHLINEHLDVVNTLLLGHFAVMVITAKSMRPFADNATWGLISYTLPMVHYGANQHKSLKYIFHHDVVSHFHN